MSYPHSEYLTILTHTPADTLKAFTETILSSLSAIEVLTNRTGLVMLPYTDTAEGALFHLGEVLVAEAHVRLENGTAGYAVCVGRDLVQALAIAILDAALRADIERENIIAFIETQRAAQIEADSLLLRQVEATRIEMETF